MSVNSTTNFTVTVSDACTGSPDPTPAVVDSALVTVAIVLLSVNAGNDVMVCPGDLVNML